MFRDWRDQSRNLKTIDLESGFWAFCLYHADPILDNNGDYVAEDTMGQRAPRLAQGCPKLARFNDLNLEELRKEGEGD